MADPASTPPPAPAGVRETVERLALAALGAVALTADRVDQLADDISARGAMRRDDAKRLLDESVTRWRSDTTRVGTKAGVSLASALREIGLVTREEYDAVELRVAQLEHRMRLLERDTPTG
jgi:polyhydroxyalkanoate synthesis regulator phasin